MTMSSPVYQFNLDTNDIEMYAGNVEKRCFKEGLAVFNSNHVLVCGIDVRSSNSVSVLVVAVCLQSSNPKSKPHEIKIEFLRENLRTFNVIGCSCLAGLGAHCKHIFAVLFYISSVSDLPTMSSTELGQKWGKVAMKSAETLYQPNLRSERACCKLRRTSNMSEMANVHVELPDFKIKQNFATLMNAFPHQSVSRHLFGVHSTLELQNCSCPVNNNENLNCLIDILNNNSVMRLMAENETGVYQEVMATFYAENIAISVNRSVEISEATKAQKGEYWMKERYKRITASICYEIYTYSFNPHPNWDTKIHGLWKKKKDNKNLKYGRDHESLARDIYEQTINAPVVRFGFVVNPFIPWIGCSPDGYVASTETVVEIKCPPAGAELELMDFVPKLRYLVNQNSVFFLKKRCAYYGQLQMNMLILNSQMGHLIIYGKKSNAILTVKVPFDDEFTSELIDVLRHTYFKYYLPLLRQEYDKTSH